MTRKNNHHSSFSLITRLVVIYLILVVTNLEFATAANSCFYYSSGKKNELPLSKEIVAVRFMPDVSLEQQEAIVQSEEKLGSFAKGNELFVFKITLLSLSEDVSEDDVIQTIDNLNDKIEIEDVYPVFAYPGAELILTDEFIVKFKPSATEDEIKAFNELNNVEIVRKPRWTERYTLRVKNPKDTSAIEMANLYYENPITVFSMPNFIRKMELLSTTPDDTYFDEQWALHNTGQNPPGGTENADMNAPEGWDISTGSSDIVIAIIDEGVDLTHEDLANKIVGGWDFVGLSESYPGDNDPSPNDSDAHGTACAGLAAGETNNGKGIAGVGWGCKIMPIRIAYGFGVGWWTTEEWLANGIEWASDNGADVLSNSWGGGPDSDMIHDAIKEAKNNGRNGKGCVVVFASGNDGSSVSYPAKYSEVIAVGATDEDDVRWSYSNYGSELDVVAPSSDGVSTVFWTTDISGSGGDNFGSTSLGDVAGNYTKWSSGTSAATPQVAGLAGLILSVNPNLTSDEVQEIIETTADDKGDSGWDQYYGWGRVNLYNAILEATNVSLSVDDRVYDGGCVSAGDYIDYKISYSNPIYDPNEPGYIGDVNDVIIVDYLPDEVDFVSANPNTGEYHPNERTYTWDIGLLAMGEGGYRFLKVQVNESAYPMDEIINTVELVGDIVNSWTTEETAICCYGGGVIYVDASVDVTDPNGASWGRAYNHLEEALAAASICDEIWVADGVYKPVVEPNMVNFVGVYGGFDGSESRRYERDWWANETIICADPNDNDDVSRNFGDPNRYNIENADYVFRTNAFVEWAVLDGFTIRRGKIGGIHCNRGSILIEHNKIIDSGIGIYCDNTETVVIRNNWIYGNETGIYMNNPKSAGVIENNTIVYNKTIGVLVESGSKPLISNCIFWGCSEPNDLMGCYATYSCIEYPNHFWDNSDPNNPIDLGIGLGNISGDPNNPLFVEADYHLDPNSYHLDPNSPCIDAGRPNFVYTGNERDIDKHFRLLYGRVDMGADEYCDECDTSDADFTGDDIVNMLDYDEFAAAWLRDSNDPNWGDKYFEYDLLGDGDAVDVNDLCVFAEDWLWMGCDAMKEMPIKESMAMETYYEMSQMSGFMQAGVLSSAVLEPKPLSIEEQIAHAKEVVDWLEKIWEEDEEVSKTIGEEGWDEFMKIIYEWLNELETNLNI